MHAGTSNIHVSKSDIETGTPKWNRKSRAQAFSFVVKWKDLLLLDRMHVDLSFSDKPKSGDDSARCAADAMPNDPYLSHYRIKLYPIFLEADDAERERYIVHEMVHFLTTHLKECARQLVGDKFVTWREISNADETLVDHIANILTALSSR